jgi:elongation factor G
MHLYATDLYSKTHGHGNFVQKFRGYEPMPGEAAQQVINDHKEAKQAAS